MATTVLFQSISALKERYPNDAHLGILGNTDLSVFLGTTDPLTADFVSRRGGETSVLVESEMESHNKFDITRFSAEYRQSQGVGKRMIMTQDEVLTMGKDNPMRAIIIMKDQPILVCEKFDYTRDPASKRWEPFSMSDFNPRDPMWFDPEDEEERTPDKDDGGDSEPVLPDNLREAFRQREQEADIPAPQAPSSEPPSADTPAPPPAEPEKEKKTPAKRRTGRKKPAARQGPADDFLPQQSFSGFFEEAPEVDDDDDDTFLSAEQKNSLAPNPVIGETGYKGSGVEL